METKLYDSELKIMEILWEEGETTAKRLAEILKGEVGWSKTTTYTVIKKCIDKGVIDRREPNFLCRAVLTRQHAQEVETNELINKLYGGSADRLVASILERKNLSVGEISRLKQLISDME